MSQNVAILTILGHWNSRKAKSPPSLSWGEERTKILLLACCYQEACARSRPHRRPAGSLTGFFAPNKVTSRKAAGGNPDRKPPSTTSAAPVTKDAWSLAKYPAARATSSA